MNVTRETLQWNPSNGVRCVSKCGRVRLRRVGCAHYNDWSVVVQGQHVTTIRTLAAAKRLAEAKVAATMNTDPA